jgi:heme-degrading monooxygenase HmoA
VLAALVIKPGMFIAMNHFVVLEDRCADFEEAWRTRESFLAGVPGFQAFHLLRGPVDAAAGGRSYASHTMWHDEPAFKAWVDSEAFRSAHAKGGTTTKMLVGPPRFVGWTVVL